MLGKRCIIHTLVRLSVSMISLDISVSYVTIELIALIGCSSASSWCEVSKALQSLSCFEHKVSPYSLLVRLESRVKVVSMLIVHNCPFAAHRHLVRIGQLSYSLLL